MHKYAINLIVVYIGYNIFTFFRDYNDFFLNARKIESDELRQLAPEDPNTPINRITNNKQDKASNKLA